MTAVPRPHESGASATLLRTGSFWVTGDLTETPQGHVQRGQMFVEWLAPERVTEPHPVVLVHGGGGQGTDWLTTPDGRPGWAYRFAAEGFAVYVVDRPGHGRSPYHPDQLGEPGAPTSSEVAGFLFAPADAAAAQTRWPWERTPGSPELEQLAAGMAFLLSDAVASQSLDGAALVRLLDRIGPAVVVTHSAGAPAGWLALNRVPDSVVAVVAVEPMGPPFMDMPGFPSLSWGLTAAPLELDPPVADAAELAGSLGGRAVVGFDGAPVLVVSGAASGFGVGVSPLVHDHLREAGAEAELLPLGSVGIEGNGHGLIFESNSDETVLPVIAWIRGMSERNDQ